MILESEKTIKDKARRLMMKWLRAGDPPTIDSISSPHQIAKRRALKEIEIEKMNVSLMDFDKLDYWDAVAIQILK